MSVALGVEERGGVVQTGKGEQMYEDEVREMKRVDRATEAVNQCITPTTQAGNYGAVSGGLKSTSIRHRIERTLIEAQSAYERAASAQRAKEIIAQHPEFAELLDALNRF